MPDKSLEEICDHVLAHPVAEREPILRDLCAGDGALLEEARQVLACYDAGSRYLETAPGALELARFESPDGDGAGGDGSLGELGHYRLLSELGRGGQGTVYLAHDTSLDRRVALKILPWSFLGGPGSVARLHREALAASRVDHPGLATVFECGEVRGIPYLAMRYVEGRTLTECIAAARTTGLEIAQLRAQESSNRAPAPVRALRADERRDQLDALLRFFEQAARALHVAHEAGLVHRDLKPGNMMVTPDCSPVILDFGLARELEARLPPFTGTGDLLGTPPYMAPEQLAPDRGPVDVRSDVYSLGVSLYEALTLVRPFEAATRELLVHQILASDPTPPRERNPKLPMDVAVVVATAMERDLRRRYQTALELADDLARVLRCEPIRARPLSSFVRLRRSCQRHPLLALSGIATVLILLATLVGSLIHVQQLRERERRLEQQVYRATIASALRGLEEHDYRNVAFLLDQAPSAERDWEWLYLQGRLVGDESVAEFVGPEVPVRFAGFLRGTNQVFGIDGAGDVQLWDRTTGHCSLMLSPLREAGDRILALAVSADGASVLSGRVTSEADGRVATEPFLWETATGRLLQRFPVVPGLAMGGAVDARGRFVSVGTPGEEGRSARIFARHPLAIVGDLRRSEGETFTVDGSALAYAGENGVHFLGLTSGTFAREPIVHRVALTQVATSPDGGLFAGIAADGVLAWEGEKGSYLWSAGSVLYGNKPGLTFSPDGQVLVTWINDAIEYWDAGSGRALHAFHCRGESQLGAGRLDRGALLGDHSWDGPLLATVLNLGDEHGVRIWDTNAPSPLVLRGHTSYVYAVAISPDGEWIASGSWDRTVRLWDAMTGSLVATFDKHSGPASALAFHPRGERLVSASPTHPQRGHLGEMHEWSLVTGERTGAWHPGARRLAFLPDGTLLGPMAMPSDERYPDSRCLADEVAAVSRDGTRLATGANYDVTLGWSAISVWDADSQVARVTIDTPDGAHAVAFSPNGSTIATGDHRGDVHVWSADAPGSEPLRVQRGHRGEVFAVTYLSDTRMATAGRDGTIRVWDARNGEELALLHGHTDYVYCLAVSPDGTRLVSGSGDGTVRIWETTSFNERKQARRQDDMLRSEAEALATRLLDQAGTIATACELLDAGAASSATLERATRHALIRLGRARGGGG